MHRVVYAVCDIRAVFNAAAAIEMVHNRWLVVGNQPSYLHYHCENDKSQCGKWAVFVFVLRLHSFCLLRVARPFQKLPKMMNILLENRFDMHYAKCTPTNAERIDGQRFQMLFYGLERGQLTFSPFYRSILCSTDPRHCMRNALSWHGVYAQTATRVYGAQAAVERLAIFGHQFCRDVYKVSNGSRSTLGIYGDAQSHGAEEGLGEGVSAHPEIARLK